MVLSLELVSQHQTVLVAVSQTRARGSSTALQAAGDTAAPDFHLVPFHSTGSFQR